MARKKWINKNAPTTQTYQLLYRSQDDPLLNDDNAGDRALFAVGPNQGTAAQSSSQPESQRALHLADLEDDLDFSSMRENEGEAAEYGIYFDDTSYDYMQHMRDLGQGVDSHFVDAIPTKVQGKGKNKAKFGGLSLDEALRQVDINDEESEVPSLIDAGMSSFSKTTKNNRRIEAQQDVPDEIAGFQPDMDPRLREALEALEDEAYVDDKDDEDLFGALALDGQNNGELDIDEFEAILDTIEDDEGWESDVTEKAVQARETTVPPADNEKQSPSTGLIEPPELSQEDTAQAVAADGDWLENFAKYKRDAANTKRHAPAAASIAAASAVQDVPPSLYTLNGTPLRQKKRKGALTNPSAYSMTSSSLNRGEGLQLLDRRFDQVEKMYAIGEGAEYEEDDFDGGASMVSGMTGASQMSKISKMSTLSTASFADPGAVRSDFNGMMDDFLGGWNKGHPGGKRKGAKGKRGKNGNEVYGLQQLEEVRKELGPARIVRKAQFA